MKVYVVRNQSSYVPENFSIYENFRDAIAEISGHPEKYAEGSYIEEKDLITSESNMIPTMPSQYSLKAVEIQKKQNFVKSWFSNIWKMIK